VAVAASAVDDASAKARAAAEPTRRRVFIPMFLSVALLIVATV
jgi:hypothetical protein